MCSRKFYEQMIWLKWKGKLNIQIELLTKFVQTFKIYFLYLLYNTVVVLHYLFDMISIVQMRSWFKYNFVTSSKKVNKQKLSTKNMMYTHNLFLCYRGMLWWWPNSTYIYFCTIVLKWWNSFNLNPVKTICNQFFWTRFSKINIF
jgi:hypothetical protein